MNNTWTFSKMNRSRITDAPGDIDPKYLEINKVYTKCDKKRRDAPVMKWDKQQGVLRLVPSRFNGRK